MKTRKKLGKYFFDKTHFVTQVKLNMQCNLFITLCLGFIEMDHVISETCYKETISQRKYRKMTSPYNLTKEL